MKKFADLIYCQCALLRRVWSALFMKTVMKGLQRIDNFNKIQHLLSLSMKEVIPSRVGPTVFITIS